MLYLPSLFSWLTNSSYCGNKLWPNKTEDGKKFTIKQIPIFIHVGLMIKIIINDSKRLNRFILK